MPKITPDGSVISSPINLNLTPKTDGRRRLSDWLGAFVEFTADRESPLDFFRWAALSTIAGAAQRKVWMENQAFVAYTNMYVVLTGPPGTKKSAAIRTGRKLLKAVGTIHLAPEAPSIVGIMKSFHAIPQKDHQSLNAFVLELSTLYENAAEGMNGFLTALYDCDDGYKKWTRVGGVEEIAYPWLNLIAGTTPQWLGDNMRKSAVEGGLFSRTIYVYSEEIILKDPWPIITPAHRKLEEYLIHDLAHTSAIHGQFDFAGGRDGDAFKWYDRWYMDRSRFPRGADSRIVGYYMRKPTHILKVAMALCLSKADDLILTEENLLLAKAMLEAVEPGMTKAFSAVGGNVYAVEYERVERLIRQVSEAGSEHMQYAELIAATYHNLEEVELQRALSVLRGMGKIVGDMQVGFRAR